jgi:hypothetical protein
MDLPYLKPFWASDKILFSYKKDIILLYINLSKSLAKTGVIVISQSSEGNVDLLLLYVLAAGNMSLSHTVVELAMLFLTEIGSISLSCVLQYNA